MKVFMGFDPGTKGFVSMIAEDGTFVKAEPIFKDIKVVDMIETANRMLAFVEGYEVRHVVIEDVHALYGSSAKGTFTFGYNSCVPEFFVQLPDCHTRRYRLKMAVGHAQGYKDGNKNDGTKTVKDVKKMSIVAAHRIFPDVSLKRSSRSLKDDDNFADSLLMAEYGRRHFNDNRYDILEMRKQGMYGIREGNHRDAPDV